MNRTLHLLFGLVIVFGFGFFVASQFAISASLSNVSNTLSRLKVEEAANHTIVFDLDGATSLDASDTIVIEFPSNSFDLAGLSNSAPLDFDINVGGSDETIVANGSCSTTDAIEITTVTADTITFTACPSYTSSSNGATITILIGDHTTVGGSGTNQIENPSVADTYIVNLSAADDIGFFAVAIIPDDQVVVSASVDPTLSVQISSNVCELGVLSDAEINTCQYNVTVSTNSSNGYNSTIVEDGNLRSAANDEITDVSGGSVIAGDEEYGVGTSNSDGGNDIVTYTTCENPTLGPQEATAITGTTQQFAAAGGPVANDATTLCHAASITPLTAPGVYSHIVTIIVTASF